MIKERILGIINDINRLDAESDTLLLIDWKTRSVMLSQKVGENIMSESFWILINSNKDKGRTLDLISSAKLKAMKSSLLKVVNNFEEYQIVPGKRSFRIEQFAEIIYKGTDTNIWVLDGEFNLKTNFLVKKLLFLLSRNYRILRESVLSVNFE